MLAAKPELAEVRRRLVPLPPPEADTPQALRGASIPWIEPRTWHEEKPARTVSP